MVGGGWGVLRRPHPGGGRARGGGGMVLMQRSNQGEKGSETPCVPSGEAHEFASKVYQLLHCPGRWSIFNLLWSPSRVTSEAGRNGFEHTCEFGRAPLKEMMRRGKGEMRGVVGPQRIHNLLSLLNLKVPPPTQVLTHNHLHRRGRLPFLDQNQ